jgi:hypothetical protein
MFSNLQFLIEFQTELRECEDAYAVERADAHVKYGMYNYIARRSAYGSGFVVGSLRYTRVAERAYRLFCEMTSYRCIRYTTHDFWGYRAIFPRMWLPVKCDENGVNVHDYIVSDYDYTYMFGTVYFKAGITRIRFLRQNMSRYCFDLLKSLYSLLKMERMNYDVWCIIRDELLEVPKFICGCLKDLKPYMLDEILKHLNQMKIFRCGMSSMQKFYSMNFLLDKYDNFGLSYRGEERDKELSKMRYEASIAFGHQRSNYDAALQCDIATGSTGMLDEINESMKVFEAASAFFDPLAIFIDMGHIPIVKDFKYHSRVDLTDEESLKVACQYNKYVEVAVETYKVYNYIMYSLDALVVRRRGVEG